MERNGHANGVCVSLHPRLEVAPHIPGGGQDPLQDAQRVLYFPGKEFP